MLLLLALLECTSQIAQPDIAEHAQPVVLFSNHGYPMTAWRNGWEGNVVADLTISSEGKVIGCQITQRSGHEILDHSTCYIISKYSQFTAARGKKGTRVEDHFRTPPIAWRLPK